MKTTSNKTEQEKKSMNKTTILAIPQCVASYTLKSLQENSINCEYVGLEEAGRILFQLEYGADQGKIIKELTNEMNECEKSINLLLSIGGEIMKEVYLKHCSEKELRK